MEKVDSRSFAKVFSFLYLLTYLFVVFDIIFYGKIINIESAVIQKIISGFSNISILSSVLQIKLSIIIISIIVGIGNTSRKEPKFNLIFGAIFPLLSGIILMILTIPMGNSIINYAPISVINITYSLCTFIGTSLIIIGVGNTTKLIKTEIGIDIWNEEAETFLQETKKIETDSSINIKTKFYYKNKENIGYININPFRGTLVLGTPGTGKTFSIIEPVIRQMISKKFTMCIYDVKYPEITNISWVNYLNSKTNYTFSILNVDDIEKSVRVNPISNRYIKQLADAQETATCLWGALDKGNDKSKGSGDFFDKSAINFVAACMFYLSKYENGIYSDLPHLLSLIYLDYSKLFAILQTEDEIADIISPYISAWKNKAYDQLEGQIGTVRINLSQFATKEIYYLFGKDEIDLRLSNKENPTILVLGSSQENININSVLYSLVLNRITKLVNTKGNLPFGLVIDEAPTLYIHRIENLIATARSNKVAVLLGIQEVPQLVQGYGKVASDVIKTVIGNIISGQAKDDNTLSWLEKQIGKTNQIKKSLNINSNDTSLTYSEQKDFLVPQNKISTLSTGEVVAVLARDNIEKKGKKWIPPIIKAKVDIDFKEIEKEKQLIAKTDIPRKRKFENGDVQEFLRANMNKIKEDINLIYEKVAKNI